MVAVGTVILGLSACTGLEAARSLGEKGIHVTGVDIDTRAIGFYSKFVKDYFLLPSDKEKMVSSLLRLGLKKLGWVLMPASDFFVTLVSQNWKTLSEHFTLTTPPWNITQYCIDKLLTYDIAQRAGIPIPQTFCPKSKEDLVDVLDQLDFKEKTWVLKSRSKVLFPRNHDDIFHKAKAVEVKSRNDLQKVYLGNVETTGEFALIQERIPGMPDRNFNVRTIINRDLEPLVIFTDRKIRQHPLFFGVGTYRESFHAPEVARLGLKFLETIKYYGTAYAEFKKDPRDGKMKLIEVNPRFGMGVSLAKACGIDLPYGLYKAFLGMQSEFPAKFENGIRWIYLRNDLWTIYHNRDFLPWGKTIRDILAHSWETKAFAYFSTKDLAPFLIWQCRR